MTDEKIKELAQRIAKDSVSSRGFSHDTLLELRAEAESNAISVIKRILETHCIVEKSKLMELDFFGHVKRHQYGCLTKDNAEYLFGEEIFNGTEDKQ